MITTLENALKRIVELEEENKKLKNELEYYKKKKFAGRQKHDDHWMQSYNDFVRQYESGMTIMDIVDKGTISRRTAYRYKAYFEEMKNMQDSAGE